MVKIKQKLDPPAQGPSYVLNLPQPAARNATEYLKAYIGYIYTASGAIAQEVASIDLHLYKATYTRNGITTQEVFEHPAISILDYMNSVATFYDVIEATAIYGELLGEAFWIVLRDGKGIPREIWPVRPDWIKVIPSATEVIDHYVYYAGGVISDKVDIPKENVIPFKYFNPLNPYRGKGTVQAAALPFDILNFAQEYNRNFFFNSAIPSMVFSSDQKISEQSVKRFLNQWQQSFGGRSKSNKVAFLGQGLKLDKASFGAKEMDFPAQMKMMRDDVLAVFKVPKTILGLTEDVNRASAEVTTRAFMERVITPRMLKLVNGLNEFYLPMFVGNDNTLFFDFTDPSPEDTDMKLKRYASGRSYTWLTPNEIRIGENLDPLPGGDDLFAPLGGSASSFGGGGSSDGGDGSNPDNTNSDNTNSNETNPDELNKPTGDDEGGKGIRGLLSRVFRKQPSIKEYTPPAYLLKKMQNKQVKHMVKLPAKRIEKIEQEVLAAAFVEPLKKFISDLISTDSYSLKDVKGKKGKTVTSEDALKLVLAEMEKEKKDKAANIKKNDERIQMLIKTGSGWTEEQKAAYWRVFIEHITQREKNIKEKCQEVFDEQRIMVIERLQDQMRSWRRIMGRKTNAKAVVPSLEALNKMWKALEDILREIYIEQGNYTMDFLGVGGAINITTEFASQYLIEYGGVLIKGINETTRDALMNSLSDGFDAGEGVDKLSERVTDIFTIASENRAELIAHTEALKASNAATVEAYRQSEVVVAKEWLAERDEHTCDFCEELDGKAIPLDDNYFDQGDTMTVGDQTMDIELADVGEPPVHPACRCTTIPVIDTSQQGEPEE